MQRNISTFAIFHDRLDCERAANLLREADFNPDDISILVPDKISSKDFAHEKATKAPEGATAGVASGAVLGGAVGWLAGIGSLAIPGVGPIIAAGPIMAMLAGATVGGAIGAIAGSLIGLGIPEYEARRYEGMVKDGGILMSVHCATSAQVNNAKRILEVAGATDVAATSEATSVTGATRQASEKDHYHPLT